MNSRIKFQALMALSLLAQSVFALDRQAEHHHGQANAHMNSMGFEQLVARFEAPGRDQWQKPEAV